MSTEYDNDGEPKLYCDNKQHVRKQYWIVYISFFLCVYLNAIKSDFDNWKTNVTIMG